MRDAAPRMSIEDKEARNLALARLIGALVSLALCAVVSVAVGYHHGWPVGAAVFIGGGYLADIRQHLKEMTR